MSEVTVLTDILAYLKTNWKKLGGITVALIVMFLIGFGTGKMSKPLKTVQQQIIKNDDKTVGQTVTTQVTTTPTIKNEEKAQEVHRSGHVVVEEHKDPQGNVTIKKTIDWNNQTDYSNKNQTASTPTTETKVATDTKTIDKDTKINTVTVTNDPLNWRLGIYAGLNVTQTPTKDNINFGLQLDRRIVGPIWLGIYADKQKNVGIQASITF